MNPSRSAHAAIGHAVEVGIVVGGVRDPAGQGLGDEPEELVRELIGRGHTCEQQVGVIGAQHVVEHRPMARRPVETLLDVGFLARDAGLGDREVGGRRGRELLREELVELGEPGLTRPRRPRRLRAADRGVEQAHAREVGSQLLDLDEHAGRLPVERAADDLHLHVGGLSLAKGPDGVGRVLRLREEHSVVVGLAVVRAVEDPRVEAVLVGAEVEHAQPHLHRRAEGPWQRARPAGRRSGCGTREGCLPRIARGCVELKAERGDQVRVVEQRLARTSHEVGRDAASEKNDWKSIVGPWIVAFRPPAHSTCATLRPPRSADLSDRLGLEHAGVEGTRRVAERLAVHMERVVRRTVYPGPRARRERVPPRTRVRRRLRLQPVVRGRHTELEERAPSSASPLARRTSATRSCRMPSAANKIAFGTFGRSMAGVAAGDAAPAVTAGRVRTLAARLRAASGTRTRKRADTFAPPQARPPTGRRSPWLPATNGGQTPARLRLIEELVDGSSAQLCLDVAGVMPHLVQCVHRYPAERALRPLGIAVDHRPFPHVALDQ